MKMAKAGCRIVTTVLTVVMISGCFDYVPTETAAVPPGEGVRVYLTRQGLGALPEEIEIPESTYLNGVMVRQDSDKLVVRVPQSVVHEGFYSRPIGQDIEIATKNVVQLERRQLDKAGTGLLIAGTAALAAGVVFLILSGSRGENNPTPPGPQEIRLPIFSIPIP